MWKGTNGKASFRLARAQMALKDFEGSLKTIESALDNLPKEGKDVELQKKEFTKLKLQTRKKLIEKSQFSDADKLVQIVSLKTEPRTPSIREFDIVKQIGEGNFSRVVVCRHKLTKEEFSLKIIEKKKADQLVKRQHPNVYNEISMERRVLSTRIGEHTHIVKMYHSFQDYNSIYFLQELFLERGDLWSTIRYQNKMVGKFISLSLYPNIMTCIHHSKINHCFYTQCEQFFIFDCNVYHRLLRISSFLGEGLVVGAAECY